MRKIKVLFYCPLLLIILSCGGGEVKFVDGEKKIWELLGYTIEQAKELKKNGLSFQEANQWKESGFNIEDIKKWKYAGFESIEAGRWKRASFSLDDALIWKNSGYSAHEASSWISAGFNMDEAKLWRQEGFDLRLAQLWRLYGFDFFQSKELIACGFERQRAIDAKCYVDKGFSISDIKELKSNDLDCENVSKWKKAGFNVSETILGITNGYDINGDYSELKAWKEAGFSLGESLELRANNFEYSNIDSFKRLKGGGYTIQELVLLSKSEGGVFEAEKWANAKIDKNIALRWIENNIGFNEAQNWISLKVTPGEAVIFKSKGQTYYDIRKNKQRANDDMQIAAALKNNIDNQKNIPGSNEENKLTIATSQDDSNINGYVFRKTKWNFSKQEVIESENVKLTQSHKQDFEGCDSFLEGPAELYGTKFQQVYGFKNEKLIKARYEYTTAGTNIRSSMENIFSRLQEKYGEPARKRDVLGFPEYVFSDQKSNTIIRVLHRNFGMGDALWVTYELYDFKKEVEKDQLEKKKQIELIKKSDSAL